MVGLWIVGLLRVGESLCLMRLGFAPKLHSVLLVLSVLLVQSVLLVHSVLLVLSVLLLLPVLPVHSLLLVDSVVLPLSVLLAHSMLRRHVLMVPSCGAHWQRIPHNGGSAARLAGGKDTNGLGVRLSTKIMVDVIVGV